MKSESQFLAAILKALGHPLRLRILNEISRCGEACVCHLEHQLGQRQAYISQQLARLRSSGLVIDRRDGLNVYYSLADGSIADLLSHTRAFGRAFSQAVGIDFKAEGLEEDRAAGCPCPKCAVEKPEALTSTSKDSR